MDRDLQHVKMRRWLSDEILLEKNRALNRQSRYFRTSRVDEPQGTISLHELERTNGEVDNSLRYIINACARARSHSCSRSLFLIPASTSTITLSNTTPRLGLCLRDHMVATLATLLLSRRTIGMD